VSGGPHNLVLGEHASPTKDYIGADVELLLVALYDILVWMPTANRPELLDHLEAWCRRRIDDRGDV
jgi:hypothetical protein